MKIVAGVASGAYPIAGSRRGAYLLLSALPSLAGYAALAAGLVLVAGSIFFIRTARAETGAPPVAAAGGPLGGGKARLAMLVGTSRRRRR